VFFVTTVTDASGWSNVDGPCDKDAKGRTGSVMELSNSDLVTGIVLGMKLGIILACLTQGISPTLWEMILMVMG